MTQVLNVSTATATREAALRLAESAISAGLAAGGQVSGPVASFFWHEGQWRGSGTRAPAPPSAPWTGTPAGVNGVCAVRVDGRELRASTSHDATVRIWDPGTGRLVHVIPVHNVARQALSGFLAGCPFGGPGCVAGRGRAVVRDLDRDRAPPELVCAVVEMSPRELDRVSDSSRA